MTYNKHCSYYMSYYILVCLPYEASVQIFGPSVNQVVCFLAGEC